MHEAVPLKALAQIFRAGGRAADPTHGYLGYLDYAECFLVLRIQLNRCEIGPPDAVKHRARDPRHNPGDFRAVAKTSAWNSRKGAEVFNQIMLDGRDNRGWARVTQDLRHVR